jgi:hypothetical protein
MGTVACWIPALIQAKALLGESSKLRSKIMKQLGEIGKSGGVISCLIAPMSQEVEAW